MHKTLLLLFIFLSSIAQAQTQRLTGKVASLADPDGLPGVTILVRETNHGTITSINGEFTLDVRSGSIIEFSFIAYNSQQITYTGQTNINIVMVEKPTEL